MVIRSLTLGLLVGGILLSCSSSDRNFGSKGSMGGAGAAGGVGAAGNAGASGKAGASGNPGTAGAAGAGSSPGAAGADPQSSAGSSGAGPDGACSAEEYHDGTACLKLTTCGADEYEKTAPTIKSDRVCALVSTCSAGTFVTSGATGSADRVCSPCAASTFSSVPNALACKPWSQCVSGESESVAPTSTSDRVCSACGAGKYSVNNQCQPLTVCTASQYESVPATATSDRKCAALTVCSASQYESAAATTVSDRKCAALKVCQPGNKQTVAPTASTDRQCAACEAGKYSTTQNAASCDAWATCTWATGGVAQAGTASSNAVCGTPSQYRQFGSSAYDTALGVATDGSGNVYVVGYTNGNIAATASNNGAAFVRKYDLNGTVVWTRQFGSASTTRATSVAPDSSGNLYVAGYTEALLQGTHYGSDDAFLRKYDSSGNVLWTQQFGTTWTDQAYGVAVDGSGYAYVVGKAGTALTGTTVDAPIAFIRKFDTSGGTLWTKQWANSSNNGEAYAVKAIGTGTGTVYVAGNTGGGELRTFALNGTPGWIQSISGTISDSVYALAVLGSGEAFVTGITSADLAGTNAGSPDVFVRKFAANGTVAWTAQFGTPNWEQGSAIAVDGNGNSYVTGYTEGAVAGTNAGSSDIFLRKYSPSGSPLSTQQFGTTSNDRATGMAVDGNGTLFMAGGTDGAFVGTAAGSGDVFLRQLVSP
ncbi:MAG TPA: SBBP repeat-containing protein [Polyangiaceae bacterium]|nr:SBBP repeat-containing protein [Polyangiaceae bacterium]